MYFQRLTPLIRFTQDSIKAEFKNGKGSLQSTIQGLRNGTISPDVFPPIRIVSHEGQLWTLDNRRLYVFQQAGLKIKTKIVFMKDVKNEFKDKFTTKNGGYTIRVRGGK